VDGFTYHTITDFNEMDKLVGGGLGNDEVRHGRSGLAGALMRSEATVAPGSPGARAPRHAAHISVSSANRTASILNFFGCVLRVVTVTPRWGSDSGIKRT